MQKMQKIKIEFIYRLYLTVFAYRFSLCLSLQSVLIASVKLIMSNMDDESKTVFMCFNGKNYRIKFKTVYNLFVSKNTCNTVDIAEDAWILRPKDDVYDLVIFDDKLSQESLYNATLKLKTKLFNNENEYTFSFDAYEFQFDLLKYLTNIYLTNKMRIVLKTREEEEKAKEEKAKEESKNKKEKECKKAGEKEIDQYNLHSKENQLESDDAQSDQDDYVKDPDFD